MRLIQQGNKWLVYVSGAYRAPSINGIYQNIHRARAAALKIWARGDVALCPHLNSFLMDGEFPDQVWLDGDLELVKRCDAMHMLVGWEQSEGATAEHALALELGLPITYERDELTNAA